MWFIVGGRGWVGQQVVAHLKAKNISYHLANSRMDDLRGIREEIVDKQPSHVVCFAGRTSGGAFQSIDYLEGGRQQTLENVRDNLFGPLFLALLTKELGIHFAYLGTGCIFNYDQDHSLQNRNGFLESDEPNFFGSSYSIVKGFTDRLFHLHNFSDHVLNLRIRMPINDDLSSSKNFISKIIRYQKICSIPNSMTVLPDLIPIMIEMIEQGKTGTVNLVNPGVISHNEILELYKEIVDPSFTWENFSLEEQNKVLKSLRSNNCLDTTELEKEFFILPIYDSVKRLLKRVHKQKMMEMAPKMKNILVTGGYGFIASNFIRLLPPETNIVNIDKVSYCSKREHLDGCSNVQSYEIDINEMESVLDILKDHNIESVVHFAAQSHVDNSFGNSIQFTQDNISGTHNLLEACKRYGKLSRFIHISTDEVYGETNQKEPFQENDLPNPTNPYAATKLAAESLVQSYFHCFDLPVIIIRGNNVFGPRQFPEKLIPKFIVRLTKGELCTVHGSGNTRRNFIYVDDICNGIYTILEKGKISEIYNIGTENEWSVLEISHKLISLLKGSHVNPNDYIEYVQDRFYNDFQYRIDCSKIKSLGWKPTINFEKGLEETIKYYLDPDCVFQ